ncbi:MAG: serine hydrolase domain-containing protein [Actinomycetota bacterium]
MRTARLITPLIALALVAAACADDADDDTSQAVSDATSNDCVDEVNGDDGAAVVSIVEQAVADNGLTSVIYRVTRGDDVLAAGAIGESVSGVPATQNMHYRTGNVAYAYLGTLLLLLAEDGTVSLDDTVADLAPDLDVLNADSVTMEMLLRNTAGYADHVRTDEFNSAFNDDPFQDFDTDELIELGMATSPFFEPGESWSYSHTGHLILGAALEAATGEDLDVLLTERVIEPLGLTNTAPTRTSAVPSPGLVTYSAERGVFEDTSQWNPSWQTAPGSVVTSTICDLVVSARGIGAGELLTEESFAEFVAPVVADLPEPPADCPSCRAWTTDGYYALGVRVQSDWIAQAPLFGGAGGVHAYLPDEELAVAIQAVAGPDTEERNIAEDIWDAIAAELTPDNPPRG